MTLADEAQRYLEVVDVFRAEGHEPHWRPEWLVPPTPRSQAKTKAGRDKQRRK